MDSKGRRRRSDALGKERASQPRGDGAEREAVEPGTVRSSMLRSVAPSARLAEFEAVSASMRQVFGTLGRLAPTDVTLMFTGETGTGKSVLAHAVHVESRRADAPFVVFDCGATDASLAEIELFGQRGAPATCAPDTPGAFERARGGTLFLDEVGDLSLELQARLLRALASRSIKYPGGLGDRSIDVRILACSHHDLEQRVTSGAFRKDLYFILASTVVVVPPLRDRLDDLPVIARRILSGLGRAEVCLTPQAFESLGRQSWPGNVRQLENVLARALAFVDAGVIEAEHLQLPPAASDDAEIEKLPLAGLTLEMIERAAIKQTLVLTGGMKVRAAEILGIAVSTLYQKLKKYGL
jgi:DNA-binding NtrC family response regulator